MIQRFVTRDAIILYNRHPSYIYLHHTSWYDNSFYIYSVYPLWPAGIGLNTLLVNKTITQSNLPAAKDAFFCQKITNVVRIF